VVELNLRRKAASLGILVPIGAVVRFEGVGEWRSRLLVAQGTQVRSYEGRFLLEGDAQPKAPSNCTVAGSKQ
jgi:hypothetical protein